MTDRYVDSAALGANNGTSWANAWTSLRSALAPSVAGDRVFVASGHYELEAVSGSFNWSAGSSIHNPIQIISADKTSGAPPTTYQKGATFQTTTVQLTPCTSGCPFYKGMKFIAGNGASAVNFVAQTSTGTGFYRAVFDDCDLQLGSSDAGARFYLSQHSGEGPFYKNTRFKFGNAGQRMEWGNFSTGGFLRVEGGGIDPAGASPTILLSYSGMQNAKIEFDGFDASHLATSAALLAFMSGEARRATFANVKLPPSWSGSPVATISKPASWVSLFNCDGANTNYKLWHKSTYGEVRDETTLVKTGGASDGVTPIAWQMAGASWVGYPSGALQSPPIAKWNETTGTPITVTVDVLHDSVTALTDQDMWLEVTYLSESGSPLGVWTDNRKGMTAAASAHPASSETWNTTGMTNPNKQKLEVTFTPQQKGFIVARAHLGVAAKTVYVDPLLQVA